MKILFVSGHYYPHVFGGTEKVVQKLAEELTRQGHEIIVATLSPNTAELTVVNGVKVYYVPLKNVYFPGPLEPKSTAMKMVWHTIDSYNPLMISALARILDRERPDVVNTHNVGGFSPATWSVTSSRRIPLVHTAHGLNLLCPWYMLSNGTNCSSPCTGCRIYAWPRLRLSQKVDVLTGVSGYLVDNYCRRGAFSNAEKMVIHNSCEVPRTPVRTSRNGRALRFGFLGRLHPSKGVHCLVDSFLQLPTGRAELLVAGTGMPEYENQLKGMANGREGVHWLGFVTPEVLLRQTDVLVVPSLVNDSAPLVILESMEQGIPIIGARRGGIPELVGKDTGWVFDPEKPGTLTEKMKLAMDSPLDELVAMRQAAIDRAREFSLGSMVRKYVRAYARAIDRHCTNAFQI